MLISDYNNNNHGLITSKKIEEKPFINFKKITIFLSLRNLIKIIMCLSKTSYSFDHFLLFISEYLLLHNQSCTRKSTGVRVRHF